MNNGLLLNLLNQVDSISHTFVFQGYQNLVNAFAPTIYALIALTITLYGYAVVQGFVNVSLREIGKRVLIIGFVIALALNWGNFSKYVYALFTDVPNVIAAQLLPSLQQINDSENVNSALEQAFYDGFHLVQVTWEHGGKTNWLPYLCAIAIGAALLAFMGIALIELIVAKFGLAIFLVLAPIIIPLTLFQPTKALVFDGWLRHLIVFAFIPIFLTAAITLGLTLLATITLQTNTTVSLHEVIPYILYVLICIGLIKKATQMAASLAHGFALTAAHSLDAPIRLARQSAIGVSRQVIHTGRLIKNRFT